MVSLCLSKGQPFCLPNIMMGSRKGNLFFFFFSCNRFASCSDGPFEQSNQVVVAINRVQLCRSSCSYHTPRCALSRHVVINLLGFLVAFWLISASVMRWSKFNKFSAYARADSHLVSQTSYGAVVTLSGAILAVILFLAEIGRFHAAGQVTTMRVDTARGDHLRITLNLTLPALPCAAISLDAIDISGTQGDDNTFSVAHNGELHKIRINADGSQKGLGEYIAPKKQFGPFFLRRPQEENAAMNSALDKHEGCNIHGWLEVQRVAGNFHLSVHADHYFAMRSTQEKIQKALKEQMENHDMQRALQVPTDTSTINMSHVIHHMAFGPQYRGQINPLDAYSRISDVDTGTFKYFIKVVPTEYQGQSGKKVYSNQYSLTEYYSPVHKGEVQLPAIYFMYDLSPIMVAIKDARASFAHLLVRLCAVVGGVFAITGMCDRWLHWLVTTVQNQQGMSTYAAS